MIVPYLFLITLLRLVAVWLGDIIVLIKLSAINTPMKFKGGKN